MKKPQGYTEEAWQLVLKVANAEEQTAISQWRQRSHILGTIGYQLTFLADILLWVGVLCQTWLVSLVSVGGILLGLGLMAISVEYDEKINNLANDLLMNHGLDESSHRYAA